MKDYINAITRNYANFSGRARRREYWMFTLVNAVILVLLLIPLFGVFVSMAAATGGNEAPPALQGATVLFALLLMLYTLAVLVPSIAITVRRLHDSGKTGWLYLLNLIPFGSLIILVFCVLDSEPGTNKWGPHPKGLDAAAAPAAANW